MTEEPGPDDSGSRKTWWPWAVVALGAILPYLINLDDYFVRDDFGVVQLLAQKPFTYFPRWFVTSWMDHIWGYYPDEIRPFPALSYQITALGGTVSPFLHHLLNVLIHAANGLLVMAIARRGAGLAVPAAMFAGLVFVLLPVHAESVAWITGRVDSMPALFYLASFLAYVVYRERLATRAYFVSLTLFFVALFTKQNTITMVATLAGYDVIVLRRPVVPAWAFLRPYVPFALMTLGYLWLRYQLFGQVAREGTLNARGLRDFYILHGRHLRHVVAGDMQAPAIVVALDPDRRRRGMARRAPRGAAGLQRCRHWPAVVVLRPDLVGDWRASSRSRRLPLAPPRLPGSGWLGRRARRHPAGCTTRPSQSRIATCRDRGRRSRSDVLHCPVVARGLRLAHDGLRLSQGCTRCPERGIVSPRGQPDHHRRARTQLGVGAAVRRPSTVPAHQPRPTCVLHLAACPQLLHRAMVRGNTTHDSRVVDWRRARFGRGTVVGSGDRRAQACHRR